MRSNTLQHLDSMKDLTHHFDVLSDLCDFSLKMETGRNNSGFSVRHKTNGKSFITIDNQESLSFTPNNKTLFKEVLTFLLVRLPTKTPIIVQSFKIDGRIQLEDHRLESSFSSLLDAIRPRFLRGSAKKIDFLSIRA